MGPENDCAEEGQPDVNTQWALLLRHLKLLLFSRRLSPQRMQCGRAHKIISTGFLQSEISGSHGGNYRAVFRNVTPCV
jgi:hypothetical protein